MFPCQQIQDVDDPIGYNSQMGSSNSSSSLDVHEKQSMCQNFSQVSDLVFHTSLFVLFGWVKTTFHGLHT